MAARRRVVGIVAGVIGVLLLLGLAAYLVIVGLDMADKLASVVGAFIGLIGLGVGVVEMVRHRADLVASAPGVTNTITGPVSGTVIQAGTINGDVDRPRRG